MRKGHSPDRTGMRGISFTRHFFGRRMSGFLGIVALAAGLTVAAAMPATAHAATPGIAHATDRPYSVPAQSVPRLRQSSDSPCSVGPDSHIWSGYVACGSAYTSVTATWVQPQVSCTSNGSVGFWVGLDGYGSDTVEQTGTDANCASGTAQYYGWWEFYPADATNYNEPVYPGDTIVASVTYEGSDTYSLKLTDVTRAWSENTTLNAVAQNVSAEVIVEATSINGQVTALPNFTAAQFTDTAIDGGSLQAAGAQQLDMADLANDDSQPPIAYPTPLSGSGFTDFYSGGLGSAAAAAFEGFNEDLYSYSSPGLAGTSDVIMPGTSPAIAELSNGTYEIAYQSSTGYLTLFNSGTVTSTGLPMESGTSPAIASSGGSYQVAFQYSTGSMWTYTPSAGGTNQFQGMLAGTSPAITALSSGGYEMAFQANTGILILYGSGGDINTGLGMKSGTSPSISAAGGGFEAAMQANTGVLWTYGTNGTADLGLGMASGTSPAIAGLATGGYELAFQTNTGVLEVYGSAADLNTGIGMAASTSPAITAVAGGGYETAIQENTGDFTVWGTAGNVQTNQAMRGGTSPSIAE
jgi:hypothetical protein